MLERLLILASYGYFEGGTFGDLFARWEQAGIFSYILPFLLIFALVNGILTRTQIFKDNKSINTIISLAVGLMALQFDFVPVFFSEIFPRLGVGLAVILGLLILVGLFVDPDDKGIMYGVFGIGVIIFIVILVKSFGAIGWSSSVVLENWKDFIGYLVFLILFIVAATVGSKGKPTKSLLAQALRGEQFL